MEAKTPKFRLRLNLFDGIVLLVALAVGAFLLWNALKPEPAPSADAPAVTNTTIRYTVQVQRFPEGTGDLIKVGDELVDNIKNYKMGRVVAAEVVPATTLIMNHEDEVYQLAEIPDAEDILVTVEATCPENETAIVLDGGYTLRVGMTTYIRGNGYMASGPVIAIEREGQA